MSKIGCKGTKKNLYRLSIFIGIYYCKVVISPPINDGRLITTCFAMLKVYYSVTPFLKIDISR